MNGNAVKKAVLLLMLANAAVSSRVACAESIRYMVISPDHVASAMKLAIPVTQSGRPSFVADSKGCLWNLDEDRDTGVVAAFRVVSEQGKPVCAVAK